MRNRKTKKKWTLAFDESGVVAIVFVLIFATLCAFMGMGVDVGHVYLVRAELQRAADGAAMAGVLGLVPYTGSAPQTPNWAGGEAAANNIVSHEANKVDNPKVTPAAIVDYGYWLLNPPTGYVQPPTDGLPKVLPPDTEKPQPAIMVTVSIDVPLFLVPLVGVHSPMTVHARAVAMLKSTTPTWSILEIGNGKVEISNNANVDENVGICGTGGTTVKNNATVGGGIYLNTTTPDPSIGNNAVVTDGIKNDDSAAAAVEAAKQAALKAYDDFVLPPTNLNGGNLIYTVHGDRDLPLGATGVNYLDVTNFRPDTDGGNAEIRITAPAGSSYVIRILTSFTLGNNSTIKLKGGIQEEGVTFVYKGTGTVRISNNSILRGSILSPNGKIEVSNNATVKGVLVSGKDIKLENNSMTTPDITWLWDQGAGSGTAGLLVN